MNRSKALELLRDHRAEMAAMGLKSVAVFGSVARNEATPGSDVDLLVEFDSPVGLFEFFEVKSRLEEILGVRVDLTTPGGLKPRVRDRILSEAIRAA